MDLWACPDDGHLLRLGSGVLECSACQRGFPLVDGIACFTSWAETDDRQRFERERRDREVDFEGDRRVRYERRVEFEAVTGRLRLAPGERVLDAGCGVGRITHQLLRTGATVLALDFSLARLRRLRRTAPAAGRLALALADVTRLPMAPASLSAIVCTQVLEHIPAPAARRVLLASFHRLLRPGGMLLLTVYNFSQPWRRRGQPAEGIHDTGIFYHCYEPSELRRELEGFEVVELCGIINLFPHTYRLLPCLGRWGRRLDHWGETRPRLSQKWGHLLLVRAVRPTSAP